MNEQLAICNAAIIAFTWYWSHRGFKDDQFVEKYIFSPAEILRDKEYYRLISSGFLHGSWMHLLFNMFSLYSFGQHIERLFGFLTFLTIYFASILGGSLLSLYLHRHHDYRALGASGGVCGIIFASIFLLPGGSVYLLLLPIPIPSPLFALLFILISYFGMRRQVDNIGHDAHLGGAIIGLLTTTVLHPAIVSRSPVLYFLVMGITFLLFWYTYRHPLHMPAPNPFSRERWRKMRSETKEKAESRRQVADEQKLDRLLEKISQSGMDSLKASERKQLDALSRKKKATDRKKKKRTVRRSDNYSD